MIAVLTNNMSSVGALDPASIKIVVAPTHGTGGGSLSWLGILALGGLTWWGQVFRSQRRA